MEHVNTRGQGLANVVVSLEFAHSAPKSIDYAPGIANVAQTPSSASPKARWNLYYHQKGMSLKKRQNRIDKTQNPMSQDRGPDSSPRH
ncbi:conserved hypothetical protein [Ricinus communis]|uniref:Uncharacterized protein n=1 Tax=Ricinus communis TaxID=3988 RepID=B9RSA0_RICCO|nr:conserved hypothetical protein [Ricinus communis]